MERWKEAHRKADEGASPVIATLILVAIAAILGATVYAFAARPQPGDNMESLALTQANAISPQDRSFSVAAASATLRWGDIQPQIGGTPLTYDGALAADRTWCRKSPDGVCTPTGSFDPSALVRAGDRIRIHDSALQGQTFTIRDPGANTLLVSIALR